MALVHPMSSSWRSTDYMDAYGPQPPGSRGSEDSWAGSAVAGHPKRKASDELQEISKEEILKEKNRIKQRNLRERRANQLASLETTVSELNSNIAQLKQTISASQEREASLRNWVEALESSLIDNNLGHVALHVRSRYAATGDVMWRGNDQDEEHRPQAAPLQHLNQPIAGWKSDYPTPTSFISNTTSGDSSSDSTNHSLHIRRSSPPQSPPGMSIGDLMSIGWPDEGGRMATGDSGLPTLMLQHDQWSPPGVSRLPFMGYQEPSVPAPSLSFWAQPPLIAIPPIHPSILAARKLISQIFPGQSAPLPTLPSLTKPQVQHLMLLALRNMSTPQEQDYYQSLQISNLAPEDSAVVLAHARSPGADPRITFFPSVLLRLRMIQAGPSFDITTFIASVFQEAEIFGQTADFHAWEMPREFWMAWQETMPGGAVYCGSLMEWRRRDGHVGATVQDVLMGCEPARSRRADQVGYPPGWRFARAETPTP